MPSPPEATRSRTSLATPRRQGLLFLAIALAFVFTLALYLMATGAFGEPTPLISEDWTLLEVHRNDPSLAAAMDPSWEPFRPLQHGFFWLLSHWGPDPAAPATSFLARAPAFLLHLASILLVHALARALGLARGAAGWAALLFAVFPNVKSLAWPATIGTQGRCAFELLALNLLVRQATAPRLGRGVGAVLAILLATGFHEGGFVTPVLFAALTVGGASTVRGGLGNLAKRLREPAFACSCVIAVAYAVYVGFLRPQRYHQVKSLDALPANLSKAALALVPEIVRAPAIEGLRGNLGLAGCVLGALALAGVAALLVAMLRAPPLWRAVALTIVVDQTLPILGAGYVQRYAYLASGLLSIGFAGWLASSSSRARVLAVAAGGLLWAFDSVTDARQYRGAGAAARNLVAVARGERSAVGPDQPIAILDAPDMWGSEEDIPLFNWGLPTMLAAQDVPGPWLFWRTLPFRTNSDVTLISPERLDEARRSGSPRVIRWNRGGRRFVVAPDDG